VDSGNVEELFRRAKKGGVVPWAPSHQWTDGTLRLHTFATVLGLLLVSLARIALKSDASVRQSMKNLADIRGHVSAYLDRQRRAAPDGYACARANGGAAPRRQGLRSGALASYHSFMYAFGAS